MCGVAGESDYSDGISTEFRARDNENDGEIERENNWAWKWAAVCMNSTFVLDTCR